MKWHQLTEDTQLDENNVWDFIQKNCQPYLKENPEWKHRPLYRGMDTISDVGIYNIRTNRKPSDTPLFYHTLYNDAFISKGIHTNRSNSVFCSGNAKVAEQYGRLSVIFPIGNFSYAYSTEIRDLSVDWRVLFNNGAFKFNNTKQPLLTKDYLSDWILQSIKSDIPDTFSFDYLNKILNNNDITKWLDSLSSTQTSEVFEILDFDKENFYKIFSGFYETTNLPNAIQSGNEIMISGNKYVAIDQEDKIYSNLSANWN